jgi:integrase
LSLWLAYQGKQSSAPTVNTYRRIILALLRFGRQYGLADTDIYDLPRMREPEHPPEAWSITELSAILHTAANLQGTVGEFMAAAWWPAVILSAYWTGARIGSLMAASPNDWEPEAAILTLRKTKNGRAATYRLHRQAAEAIGRIYRPDAERLFPWPHSRWTLFRVFRRIVNSAGVPCRDGQTFGLFHRVRRTTITYCWAADPAIAQRQADHSSAVITWRYYVDRKLIQDTARSAADVLPVPEICP